MLQIEIEKGIKMEQDLIKKYEAILPTELLDIWGNYGQAVLMDGYLRVVNPEEYQELLNDTYFRGKISIPIMTTAFGDIITLEEGKYIGIARYKNRNFNIMASSINFFIHDLADADFLEEYFQVTQYMEAVERLGKLKHDECFGYVPLLGLGGGEKVENLKKVKIREHIELISVLVGRIGM